MSYLNAIAAAENQGTGVNGYLRFEWHNVGTVVTTTPGASDWRGDIQIRWDQENNYALSAYLTVQEARVLRQQLDVILDEFTGIDNEVEDQDTINADGSASLPQWVHDVRKYGLPSVVEQMEMRENNHSTTGSEGVA